MIDPENIKTIYSEEVLGMVEDVWIKKEIETAHELRLAEGRNPISDFSLLNRVLDVHNRMVQRRIEKRKKKLLKEQLKGVKNG